MSEKLITVREASEFLGITEKEVIDLANEGKIPAYKIGGEFLRFRFDQIQQLKVELKPTKKQEDNNFKDSVIDFFYFNDFYIFTLTIIIIIIFFILK